MSGYFYRGRHRAPTDTSRRLAAVAAGGAVATAPLGLPAVVAAPAAHADILDVIEQCESGGQNVPNAQGSSASGFWQITDGTWADNGGLQFASRAINATRAEQEIVAQRLLASRGTQPWVSSQSCWAGKGGSAVQRRTPESARNGSVAPRRTPSAGRAADGTGSYTCGPSFYSFAACDPGMDGQTRQFPLFDGHGRHSSGAVKAATTAGRHWPNAPADLHLRDSRGLGTMLCDPAHSGYQSCDPPQYGRAVPYPLFD